MARVTAEERGEDLCHFSFHICGLLLGKWGGAGDECGKRELAGVDEGIN